MGKDNLVRAHLATLGIELGEAKGIFNLLDLDKSGSVTIEEFVFGLMRIKGNAKALDTATLLYENKRMMQCWQHFMLSVEEQFKRQRIFEDRTEKTLARLYEIMKRRGRTA